LERSDLIPDVLTEYGNILLAGMYKYNHFFLINLAVNNLKTKLYKNNVSKY